MPGRGAPAQRERGGWMGEEFWERVTGTRAQGSGI